MAIEFPCSGCAERFVVAEVTAGRKGKCPKCAVVNVVPRNIAAIRAAENGSASAAAPPLPTPESPPATAGGVEVKPTEPAPVKWVPPAKRKRRWRLPRFLVGGVVTILLLGLLVGGYILVYRLFGPEATKEPAAKRAGSH